jgi:hypothetical protein
MQDSAIRLSFAQEITMYKHTMILRWVTFKGCSSLKGYEEKNALVAYVARLDVP